MFALIPSAAFAQSLCEKIERPQTNFNLYFTLPDPSYSFTKTQKQLTEENQQTISKWLQKQGIKSIWMADHMSSNFSIGGLASGGYAASFRMGMRAKPYDRYGTYFCPYFTNVTIDLYYNTLIFMPSDFPRKSCRFTHTMDHEMLHHKANLQSIMQNSQKMEEDIQAIIHEIENQGYVAHQDVENKFESMKHGLEDAVTVYLEKIHMDSRRLNDAIDTPQEYARVDRLIEACEKEDRKI